MAAFTLHWVHWVGCVQWVRWVWVVESTNPSKLLDSWGLGSNLTFVFKIVTKRSFWKFVNNYINFLFVSFIFCFNCFI